MLEWRYVAITFARSAATSLRISLALVGLSSSVLAARRDQSTIVCAPRCCVQPDPAKQGQRATREQQVRHRAQDQMEHCRKR